MGNELTAIQRKFIGTKRSLANGSIQEVIGLHEKRKTNEALFKVSCSNCDNYPTIFPEGIIMTKDSFTSGKVPCLCNQKSFRPVGEDQKAAYYKMLVERDLQGYTYKGYTKKNGSTLLIVECELCSKDTELFPEGSVLYHIHTKTVTCPCYSKYLRKTPNQFKVLVERRCREKGYELKSKCTIEGSATKVLLFNPTTNNEWECSVDNFLNIKRNDPAQAGIDTATRCRLSTPYVENIILSKLGELGGEFLGWERGYHRNTSKFNWKCKNGHTVTSSYCGFSGKKVGCRDCVRFETPLYGFFPDRLKVHDNLYVFRIDSKYLKVGRTFDLQRRLSGLKYQASSADIELIQTVSGTHEKIYQLEQSILSDIKRKGMLYESGWTIESCTLESMNIIMEHIKHFEKDEDYNG